MFDENFDNLQNIHEAEEEEDFLVHIGFFKRDLIIQR